MLLLCSCSSSLLVITFAATAAPIGLVLADKPLTQGVPVSLRDIHTNCSWLLILDHVTGPQAHDLRPLHLKYVTIDAAFPVIASCMWEPILTAMEQQCWSHGGMKMCTPKENTVNAEAAFRGNVDRAASFRDDGVRSQILGVFRGLEQNLNPDPSPWDPLFYLGSPTRHEHTIEVKVRG